MNKFIQSTKQFLSKKPIRIVVALLVIAGIMTGVAFGIMALINTIKKPENQCKSGYHYDKGLKVCVKDGCKNICNADTGEHKPGDCLPDNYCDYSGPEGQYYFDSDNCACKLDCSSLGEEYQGFTTDGKTKVEMQLQSDGTYKPHTDNILYCGSSCEYSEIKDQLNNGEVIGGTKWCKKGFICGKNLFENQDPSKLRGQCYDENIYNYCKEPNDDNVVCKNSGEGICAHNGPKSNARCVVTKCGYDSDFGLACKSDSDCTSDGTIKSGFTCNKIVDKNFQHVGICENTNKSNTDKYCILKDKIGENFNGEIIKCDEDHFGISSAIKQCKNGRSTGLLAKYVSEDKYQTTNFSCTKSICSNNKWQAAPNNIQDQCMSAASTPEICHDITTCHIDNDNCCDIPYSREEYGKIKKGCCNRSIEENPNCLLTTTLPFDGHFLNSTYKFGSQITCDHDKYSTSDTKKQYDQKLRSFLNVNSNDETVQTYCSNDNLIHGQCGDLDINNDTNLFGFFPTSSKTEICTKKKLQCNIDLPVRTITPIGSGGNDLIICEDKTLKQYWGGNSTNKGEKSSYAIQTKKDSCPMSNYVAYFKKNIELLDGLESIEPQKKGTEYKYTWNCNAMKIPVNGKYYNWNSIAEPTYIKNNPDLQKLFPNSIPTKSKGIKISRTNTYHGHCNGDSSFPEKITKSFWIKNPRTTAGDCMQISNTDDYYFLDPRGIYCLNTDFDVDTGYCK